MEERPALEAPPTLAEYLLARGEPEETLDMLRRTMLMQSVDPRVADRMVMWGARASADLAAGAGTIATSPQSRPQSPRWTS